MKPFALARVLQLAERRSETLARTVKLAHGVWLRARGRQVQLTALRDAHIAQLAGELRGGVTAAQLQEKNRLQHAQAGEMQAAQEAIDAAHRDWQARLAEWMQVEQRVKALRLLEQRHLAQAAIQQRRIEQRQHDELVELTLPPCGTTGALMQLLQLTPAEIAFLTTPPVAADGLQTRLTRKLAATLTARLRLPVQVTGDGGPTMGSAVRRTRRRPAGSPMPRWPPCG